MKESNTVLRTKKAIIEALLQLLIEKHYDEITVVEICEKALITKATFYNYYEDKLHLVMCIIEIYKDKLREKIEPMTVTLSLKEQYLALADICFDFVQKNIARLKIYLKHITNDKLRMLIMKIIDQSVIDMMKEQKCIVEYKVPLKYLSTFFAGGISYLVLNLLENDSIVTKEELLSFVEAIIDGTYAKQKT